MSSNVRPSNAQCYGRRGKPVVLILKGQCPLSWYGKRSIIVEEMSCVVTVPVENGAAIVYANASLMLVLQVAEGAAAGWRRSSGPSWEGWR